MFGSDGVTAIAPTDRLVRDRDRIQRRTVEVEGNNNCGALTGRTEAIGAPSPGIADHSLQRCLVGAPAQTRYQRVSRGVQGVRKSRGAWRRAKATARWDTLSAWIGEGLGEGEVGVFFFMVFLYVYGIHTPKTTS